MAVPQKEYELYLDLKYPQLNEKIKFMAYSVNTAELYINLTEEYDPIDISNSTVQVVYEKPDGKIIVNSTKDSVSYIQIINAQEGKIKLTININIRCI